MDLGGQAHRVKFMIRDRGSNFTAAFDIVLADAGVRTVLCNVRTPRMNAIAERWIGGCRRELLTNTAWSHDVDEVSGTHRARPFVCLHMPSSFGSVARP